MASRNPLTENVCSSRAFQYDSRQTSFAGAFGLELAPMRNFLTVIAALVMAAPAAMAQPASKAETQVVSTIVECLVEGLPEDWERAEMIVELAKPGAESGDVQYLVARTESEGRLEPFTPCDVRKPARALLDARKSQAPNRRGWTAAKLVLQRDGKFGLNYDYPKPGAPGKKK